MWYFYFSDFPKHTEILSAISTDHSPVLCSFQNFNQCPRGPGLWKFSNSLVSNEEYVLRLKELVNRVKGELNCNNQVCEEIYDDIAEGIKVISKCQWYEEGQKSINNKDKEVGDSIKINKQLERFFENVIKRKFRKTKHIYNEFLRDISLLTVSQGKKSLTRKSVNKKWFLQWKLSVITNLQETMSDKKKFMKLFGKNWNNHSWIC